MKKPILQYDKNGNFLKEYDSVKRAAAFTGIRSCNISRKLTSNLLRVNRYIWKYKDFDKVVDYQYVKDLLTKDIILDRFGNEMTGLNTKTRKRDYPDLRMVFFKLCSLHVGEYTLETCAKFVGQDHSTAVHALKKFKYTYDAKLFIHKDLFDSVNNEIKKQKKRHQNEISTGRQNIYTMTKKALVLEILKSDKKILDLQTKLQTIEASKMDVIYKAV